VRITYSTAKALIPTAVALGNFDGLHRGHQRVIQPVLKTRREAGELLAASEAQVYATVVTFNPHPQEFFTGQPRALLTPLPEKVQQLISWNIEQLVLLPFDRELAALSPQDFVEKILVQLQAQMISVGEDFRFGKQRCGTAADLQAIAAKFGIPVTIVPNYTCVGERISSSAIRQALTEGNLQRAKVLLDRPYTLTGTVVKGQQLGRTIGFPTANIQLPANKFVPQQGVYAVRVFMEKARESVASCPLPIDIGVMNIGYRPTVNGNNQSVEVHLLDWSGDLYDKTLTVQLEEFLRPEQKFSSLEDLKSQIAADCDRARSLLRQESSIDYEKVD
jgi:riboflavin kinase/FMN adenylyltransferase